jgi:hypothetical protein
MNRGHRFRDLLPCLNDRAVIRSFSGRLNTSAKLSCDITLSPLLPLPKERLTLSVTCAFKFKRAEYLPEGGVVHRGDMNAAPLTNTAGNMPPEGFQRRINLLGRNIVSLDTWMTTGLYSLSVEGERMDRFICTSKLI